MDIQGARLSLSIPITERLLNALVAATLPPAARVRDLSIHPQHGNRFVVRMKVPGVSFLPPVSVTVVIEQQPAPPDSPLVLRLTTWPGLMRMIGAALPLASFLPPGVRMEQERILVDLNALAERHGYGDLVPLVKSLQIRTEASVVVVEAEARV